MQIAALARIAVVSAFGNSLLAAAGIIIPDATVGRGLAVAVSARLPETRPNRILKLTITSDDPTRLLLSDAPDKAGSASIAVTVPPRVFAIPTFWLQGRADSGAATYTVSAEGMASAKAKVNLAPSTIVIVGPSHMPRIPTTPRAAPARITVVCAALSREGKVQEQELAGGSRIEVQVSNSNPEVGKLRDATVVLVGGSSSETTQFEPAAEGETTLTPVQPPGFRAAKEYASVVVAVSRPGLAIDGEIFIGKDLQVGGALILGEPAPPSGVEVTLTSADPSKLVLALRPDQEGVPSIKISVPPGQFSVPYFVHALADSGIVTYEAVAPGYRSRTARVGLTRSGVIVAYDPYGPPDEAAVLRKAGLEESRAIFLSLGNPKEKEVKLVAWTAYLDPETGQAADITVQPLRPGVKATINLTSSNPQVGAVQSPLTILGGRNHAISRFTPLTKGTTIISVDTPPGFTVPKNATTIPANVND